MVNCDLGLIVSIIQIMIITVSEKGQLVIPAQLRRSLGITAGTRLDIIPEPGGF